jgi:endonuclease/exonuclease/phosphatase family metal-dependent hydrolase
MPEKLFSILSWNVEHFGKGKDKPGYEARIIRVAEAIEKKNPDVMAIYEVTGKEIYQECTTRFTDYSFFITEGRQSQEILVGSRKSLNTFITQRTEFKASNPYLRPGALLTIKAASGDYSILLLHLKSLSDPYGWGLRDFMWEKMRNLKKALNKMDADARYIVLGDLNTMGMNLTYSPKDISAEEELNRMVKMVERSSFNMKLLSKSHPKTYFNGSDSNYEPADLDHVFATNNIEFLKQSQGSEVEVQGWPQANDPDQWIKDYSDHAMLYLEVAK